LELTVAIPYSALLLLLAAGAVVDSKLDHLLVQTAVLAVAETAKRRTILLVLETLQAPLRPKGTTAALALAALRSLVLAAVVAALAEQVLPLVRQVLVETEALQAHRLLAALQFITPEAVVAATKCRELPV
jgi:hypothetical protein